MQPLNHALDPVPIWALFLTFVIVGMVCYEGGVRVGLWWQERTPDEKEGPTGMLVGALLALMAFLLAVTMGMASDRYDQRRALVVEEANSIGTTYLRAGYLPQPEGDEVRNLIREYVPLRVSVRDDDETEQNDAASAEIAGSMWTLAEELARQTPEGDMLAIFVESLNQTIDLRTERIVANIRARVPETVIMLLLAGTAVTLGMVGYSAGLTQKRSLASAAMVAITLAAVLALIIDLDRPTDGLITVNQGPLTDLQNEIGGHEG